MSFNIFIYGWENIPVIVVFILYIKESPSKQNLLMHALINTLSHLPIFVQIYLQISYI